MAYYLTVSPPLASENTRRAFFETLCRASITEAFYFCRQHDDEGHRYYLQHLISFVLSTDAGATRKDRAMELVNLPLNDQEEEWFEDHLLQGTAKVLPGAKDTVLMRRFAIGTLQNLSAEFEWLGGRKLDGIDWDGLRQSISRDAPPMPALGVNR
jgi:Nuclear pore complex assembly